MNEEYHIIKPSGFFHYNGMTTLKLLIEELKEKGKLDSTPLKHIEIDENGYLKIKKDKELINKVYSYLTEWYYENVIYKTQNTMYLIDITKKPVQIIETAKRNVLPISKEKPKNLKPLVYAMSKEDLLKLLGIDEEKLYAQIENAIKEELSEEELDFVEKEGINIKNFDKCCKDTNENDEMLIRVKKNIGRILNSIIYKTNKKNSLSLNNVTQFYVYKGSHIEDLGKDTIFELKEGKECYICSLNLTKKVRSEKEKEIVLDSEINMMDFGTSPPVNRDRLNKYSFPICGLCEIIYRISLFSSFYCNNYVINFYTVPFQNNLNLIKNITRLASKNMSNFPKSYEGNKRITSNIKESELKFGTFTPSLFLLSLLYYISDRLKRIKEQKEDTRIENLDLEIDKIKEFYNDIEKELNVTRTVILEKSDMPTIFETYYELTKKIQFLSKVEDSYSKEKKKSKINPIMSLIILIGMLNRTHASEEINTLYEELSKNLLEGSIRFVHTLIPPLFLCVNDNINPKVSVDDINIIINSMVEVYGMENKDLIEKAKELGKSIGYLAGQTENKDMLYQLRETKTKNSLIKLLKEVLYVGLRNLEGDNKNKIIGNIKNNEGIIYNIMEQIKDEEIDIFIDMVSVYAVLNYFSVIYAKEVGGEKNE